MRVEFQGRNYEIEARFIEHARPRLEGLYQYAERLREVKCTVWVQRERYTVELTCDIDGMVVRSETQDNEILAAFDQALEKVERQLTRWKGKLVDRRKRRGSHREVEALPPSVEPDVEEPELEEFNIVRTKAHTLKPMTPQEAVLQMEMVGHDFYVFLDGDAQRVGVVYRRRDGGYGLIEPGVEQV